MDLPLVLFPVDSTSLHFNHLLLSIDRPYFFIESKPKIRLSQIFLCTFFSSLDGDFRSGPSLSPGTAAANYFAQGSEIMDLPLVLFPVESTGLHFNHLLLAIDQPYFFYFKNYVVPQQIL